MTWHLYTDVIYKASQNEMGYSTSLGYILTQYGRSGSVEQLSFTLWLEDRVALGLITGRLKSSGNCSFGLACSSKSFERDLKLDVPWHGRSWFDSLITSDRAANLELVAVTITGDRAVCLDLCVALCNGFSTSKRPMIPTSECRPLAKDFSLMRSSRAGLNLTTSRSRGTSLPLNHRVRCFGT
jgi:hypothetical protein